MGMHKIMENLKRDEKITQSYMTTTIMLCIDDVGTDNKTG